LPVLLHSDFYAALSFSSTGSHHIRVRNTDAAGLSSDTFFDIVIDEAGPAVHSVEPISKDSFGATGFRVQFSEETNAAVIINDGSIYSAIG
jgi:hypothetical protein